MSDDIPDVGTAIVRVVNPASFTLPITVGEVVRCVQICQFTSGSAAADLSVELLSPIISPSLLISAIPIPATGALINFLPPIVKGETFRFTPGAAPGDLVDLYISWVDYQFNPGNPVSRVIRSQLTDVLPFSLLNGTNRVLWPWRPLSAYFNAHELFLRYPAAALTIFNPDTVSHTFQGRRIRAALSAFVSQGSISANGASSASSAAAAGSGGAIGINDAYELIDITPVTANSPIICALLTEVEPSF
jgi:hypothetical protein